MEFIDEIVMGNEFLAAIGTQNIIIILVASLIVLIILLVAIRTLRLRKYRKVIVTLENEMNAVKSLPIQYRLGRVQGIIKNMPAIDADYDEFVKEHEEIVAFQMNEIAFLLNEVDERLYANKLKGVKKDYRKLQENNAQYSKRAHALLERIEQITEVENEQRIAIIKIKERYREIMEQYTAVRYKIEEFVPAVNDAFKDIDNEFVRLEDLMNGQKFEEASSFSLEVSEHIEKLQSKIEELPTYIAVVRKYIPTKLEEISNMLEDMSTRGFATDSFNATIRCKKVEQELELVIVQIKALELDSVGKILEYMTTAIDELQIDIEKEEKAFTVYQEKRDECFSLVYSIEDSLLSTAKTFDELQKNYLLSHYDVNIHDECDKFHGIVEKLELYKAQIDTKSFSYDAMIKNFDSLVNDCKPYEISLKQYLELKDSLVLQEKRALTELDNINIVLLEIKSEIKNKRLPMINDSYKDYIDDSYIKAEEILRFTRQRPIDLERLSTQVDTARDVIYKLYDNVHNLIVTAEMVEDAIVFGNRYRSCFLEVNTELTKAELLFRNGEYTKALSTAVDIIEKIKPGSYEMLVLSSKKSK